MPTLTFPTHGYGVDLLNGIPPPDIEGFSSFHVLIRTLSALDRAAYLVASLSALALCGVA